MNVNLSDTALLVYLIAGAGALAVGGFVWYLVYVLRSKQRETVYEAQLQDLISGYSDEDELMKTDHGRNLIEKWNVHWKTVARSSGMAAYSERENAAPLHAAILAGAVFFLLTLISRNPIVGLAAAAGVTYGLSALLKMRHNRQASVIQDQLSGFLFALKANIQANETPVRAILKVVDNMPDPLRTDLMIVKQKIMANASFADALEALIQKTNSTELKFLAACLIQAAGSGANIEPQINTIQKVLEQRRAAADELNKAVRATLPSIYVGSFAIPGSFVAAYLMDPTAKEFWFREPLSYAALGVVAALYGVGMFMTRKMVESIRNL